MNHKRVKITDTNLVRDMHSKAILNPDRAALNEYMRRKNQASEINTLKEEMASVKELLTQILERLK